MRHSNPSEISVGGSTMSSPAVMACAACAAAPELEPSAAIPTVKIHALRALILPPVAQIGRQAARIRCGAVADQAEARPNEAHHHWRLGAARAARGGARAHEDRARGS